MESNNVEYVALGEGSTPNLEKFQKVSIIPLIFLNYWDSISTLAGEVDNPEVATLIGGVWLRFWVQTASAISNMGMFVAEMSSDSFQLLGMAERGMLPEFFAKRSRYGTPLIGILFSASGVILLSWLTFQEIVAAENFLYCFGMLMQFIAFVTLRIKYPSVYRPYKVPVGTFGAILMCIAPTLLIFVVLAHASFKVLIISISAVIIGLLLQPCLKYMEHKRLFTFSINSNVHFILFVYL